WPNRPSVVPSSLSNASAREMSTLHGSTSTSRDVNSSAAAASLSASMSTATMCAPRAARLLAMACPMPPPAPVTTATLSRRVPISEPGAKRLVFGHYAARVELEPAGAGGRNRLGRGRGQFTVPHAVEHPLHRGDNLRACRDEAGPGEHGGRVGQLIGQPGNRVG